MLSRIETARATLRRSERRVADLVLANPNAAVNLSIAAIAAQAGVSQPTVARFCRALGFPGYKDFKIRLTQSLAAGVPYVHSEVAEGDKPREVALKVFDRSIAALMRAKNLLDLSAIDAAVELLSKAERIEFYGLGNSGIVAQDAQHKFFRLGFPSVAYADPHVHGMAAALLTPKCVVVAISSTGRTIDLIKSIEVAREQGAAVIGITAIHSPLARICSVTIGVDVNEDPDIYSPMNTRLAHLTTIDALAVGVAVRLGPKATARLERAKKSLKDRRLRTDD